MNHMYQLGVAEKFTSRFAVNKAGISSKPQANPMLYSIHRKYVAPQILLEC